jgi:hypothetical protein
LEDKDKVFENGPYFYNSAGFIYALLDRSIQPGEGGIFLHPSLDPLYSLPQEFWLEEILIGIGNTTRKICQIFRGHEANKIHFLCLNLCLHEYLEIPPRIGYHRISG